MSKSKIVDVDGEQYEVERDDLAEIVECGRMDDFKEHIRTNPGKGCFVFLTPFDIEVWADYHLLVAPSH